MRKTATAMVLAALTAATALTGATAAEGAGRIVIYKVYYDSPGSDSGSNSSLNAEYVLLKNVSTSTRELTGWRLKDKAGHTFTFPKTWIGAGKYMYVRTGKGSNDSNERFWGQSWYIWNNTGDTAYLRTPGGTLYDSCSWGSSGDYKFC